VDFIQTILDGTTSVSLVRMVPSHLSIEYCVPLICGLIGFFSLFGQSFYKSHTRERKRPILNTHSKGHFMKMKQRLVIIGVLVFFASNSYAQVGYNQIGNTTVYNNGVTANQVGNSTVFSNGLTANQIGNTTVYSNGVSANQIGNTTVFSNGVTANRIGNTTVYSNGVSANQIGNTTVFSNGVTANRIGNTTVYSNGRSCNQIGNTTVCN